MKRKIANVRVDLSKWDTGDWEDRLIRSVKTKANLDDPWNPSIEFEFDCGDVVREIATKAIIAFLETAFVDLTQEGVELLDEDDNKLKFEWGRIAAKGDAQKAIDAWRAHLLELADKLEK